MTDLPAIPTAHQSRLLSILDDLELKSLRQVAEILDCSRPNAKFRLDALKKHGWVRESGGDGEAFALTAEGKKWVRRLA